MRHADLVGDPFQRLGPSGLGEAAADDGLQSGQAFDVAHGLGQGRLGRQPAFPGQGTEDQAGFAGQGFRLGQPGQRRLGVAGGQLHGHPVQRAVIGGELVGGGGEQGLALGSRGLVLRQTRQGHQSGAGEGERACPGQGSVIGRGGFDQNPQVASGLIQQATVTAGHAGVEPERRPVQPQIIADGRRQGLRPVQGRVQQGGGVQHGRRLAGQSRPPRRQPGVQGRGGRAGGRTVRRQGLHIRQRRGQLLGAAEQVEAQEVNLARFNRGRRRLVGGGRMARGVRGRARCPVKAGPASGAPGVLAPQGRSPHPAVEGMGAGHPPGLDAQGLGFGRDQIGADQLQPAQIVALACLFEQLSQVPAEFEHGGWRSGRPASGPIRVPWTIPSKRDAAPEVRSDVTGRFRSRIRPGALQGSPSGSEDLWWVN